MNEFQFVNLYVFLLCYTCIHLFTPNTTCNFFSSLMKHHVIILFTFSVMLVRATSGKAQGKGQRQGLVSKSAKSNAKDRANKETTVTLTRLKGMLYM